MTHDQIKEDLILYAAGALDGADLTAMQEHLRTCQGCRSEVDALEADITRIRKTLLTATAPDSARTRLMSEISKSSRSPNFAHRTPQWVWAPVAASIILAVGLLFLSREFRKLEVEVASARDAMTQANRERAQAEGILEALQSPEAVRVTLSPVKAPLAQPRVDAIYSPGNGRLVVMAANLAPVADDKAYQLWLLPKTGAPIPAGTFRPDATGRAVYTVASFQTGSAPAGFAVTVEPLQGSTTPTMPIILIGKVT